MSENQRAYEEGSAAPPEKIGVLRLYGMRFCPYAERIRLLLKCLKIKYEIVNINTNSKPEWFLQLNPDGNVPVIVYKKTLLSQSLLCLEFINEEFGKSKFLAKEPIDRAVQRIMMDRFDKIATAMSNILKSKEPPVFVENQEKISSELQKYEDYLKGDFFGDKKLCLVDFAIWPWFERFASLEELTDLTYLNSKRFPKLEAWMARMKSMDIVREIELPNELHLKYFRLKQNGSKDVELVNLGLDS